MASDRSPETEDFEDYYNAHYRRVRAYVSRRVPAQDVDDVLVDVFAAAARWFPERPPTRERQVGWLIVTARNSIGNLRRSGRRSRALSERLRFLAPMPPIHHDRPSTEGLDNEVISHVFDKLSADDRAILLLVAWDRCTTAELAEILACSPGAAKVRLSRAKSRFRQAFAGGSVE